MESGDALFSIGYVATHWCGVMEGLLKMSTDSEQGLPLTYAGLRPGGRFREGKEGFV